MKPTRINEMGRLWKSLQTELAGQAAAALNDAHGFAEQRILLAEGDSDRFRLRQAAHADSPALTEWRLYVDALSAALPGKQKLILDSASGGRRHLMLGFPRDITSQLPPLIDSPFNEHEE